jgi:WhiB family redox-sensing transcriptional regulator
MKQIWRQHAACRGLDPLVFYPVTDEEAEYAKHVCSGCPVREACLEHALAVREKEGVWGGATERERRRIIRQRPCSARSPRATT